MKIEELATKLYENTLREGEKDDFTIVLKEGLKLKVAKNLHGFPNGTYSIQEIHELQLPKKARQGVLTFFESTSMTVTCSDDKPGRLKLELRRHGASGTDILQSVDMDQHLHVEVIQSGNLPSRLADENMPYGKSLRVDDLAGNLSYLITGINLSGTFERWKMAQPAWTIKEVVLNASSI